MAVWGWVGPVLLLGPGLDLEVSIGVSRCSKLVPGSAVAGVPGGCSIAGPHQFLHVMGSMNTPLHRRYSFLGS